MNSKKAIDYGDHPIFDSLTFYIPTPMIEELRQTILQWLWCGCTGGYILGESRVGKSRALEALIDGGLFTRSKEPIPIHYASISDRDISTITSVFRNLCLSIGAEYRKGMLSDDMVSNLLHFFAESAQVNKIRLVVLIVDEMQHLVPKQFNAFAEIRDKLEKLREKKTNLVVVFVGNVIESEILIKNMRFKKYDHVRGRFFTQSARFYGLKNKNDMEHCLQEYDSNYNKGELSCTEYFLPNAYRKGWRIKSLSDPIWAIYRSDYGKPLRLESWPMQYFTAAIKTLLVDYLPKYGVERQQDIEDMIHRSLAVSGLCCDRVEVDV